MSPNSLSPPTPTITKTSANTTANNSNGSTSTGNKVSINKTNLVLGNLPKKQIGFGSNPVSD